MAEIASWITRRPQAATPTHAPAQPAAAERSRCLRRDRSGRSTSSAFESGGRLERRSRRRRRAGRPGGKDRNDRPAREHGTRHYDRIAAATADERGEFLP
jgi:hypothetical protein